jgi:cytochrome b6-f complex iron-sulfur subunit
MGSREPGDLPALSAITADVIRAQRAHPVGGLSRRTLLRRSLGLGLLVWGAELVGGSIAFGWSVFSTAPPRVRVGTLADIVKANPGLPIAEGFPAAVPGARAFVMLVDPTRQAFFPGVDLAGEGSALNVRALYQRCPHLGCRPNPCVEDFWFRCPCHQSRYDRLGIKAAGTAYGPAQRSMDRYAIEVDAQGVLTIDTSIVTLGPLPVALGQPGIIPPLVENGCF